MSEYKANDAPDNLTECEACAWAAGAEYGAHVEREKWQRACPADNAAERDRLRAEKAELAEALESVLDIECYEKGPYYWDEMPKRRESARAVLAETKGDES